LHCDSVKLKKNVAPLLHCQRHVAAAEVLLKVTDAYVGATGACGQGGCERELYFSPVQEM